MTTQEQEHMRKLQIMRIRTIGPSSRVPEEFQDSWGGQYGCPCKDRMKVIVGYVERMPHEEEDFYKEILRTFMAV